LHVFVPGDNNFKVPEVSCELLRDTKHSRHYQSRVARVFAVQAAVDPHGRLAVPKAAKLSVIEVAEALAEACAWPDKLAAGHSNAVNSMEGVLKEVLVNLSRCVTVTVSTYLWLGGLMFPLCSVTAIQRLVTVT
jgi:hypothetical protein